MKKKLLLLISFSLSILFINAQTIESIKQNRDLYLWGEGTGSTLKKADSEALEMLISQISIQVESKFTLLKEEHSGTNSETQFEEKFSSIIRTYSYATMNNAERIVISNEPDASVLRYIKRNDLDKIFSTRKNKIIGFAQNAIEAMKNRQIADALRYYYWSLTLLKSHPDGNSITISDEDGNERLLATWLPMQINTVFSGLNLFITDVVKDSLISTVTLDISYNNMPVTNFDYCYWDGRDWSNIISAKDGLGFANFIGQGYDIKEVKIKAEYIFEGEASVDNELRDVMQKSDPVPFRNSYITVKRGNLQKLSQTVNSINNNDKIWQNQEITLVNDNNQEIYQSSMKRVVQAIKTKKYELAQNEFTPEGYEMFQKIVQYGKGSILREPEQKYIQFGNGVICRYLPMSFNFENNNKQFVEDVIFNFDENKKISSISFGLGAEALKDIVGKQVWSEQVRLVLITFLEFYKTAYALKRYDYIESIFADDALIIVGSVLKVTKNNDNKFLDNKIIKYNRYSKTEYMKNLKLCFQGNEFINLKFEENAIRKSGKGGEVYGIQIKQNYNSTSYGDVGYLFLMVDLNEPEQPVIHVRTWQPDKDPDGSIYGLGNFN